MSDQSIFGNQPNSQETPENTDSGNGNTPAPSQNSEPFAHLLGSIKNEQGKPKYGNTEEALKALAHSQEFIPQLKNENQRMKEELETLKAQLERMKGVEETIEKLTSSQRDSGNTNQPAFDENVIADVVQRTISKRESEAIQKANITGVVSALQSKFGNEAEKTFYTKAQELGMDVQQMNMLAATSPKAVLNLFGLQGQEGRKEHMPSAVKSGENTAGFQPKQDTFIGRNSKTVTVGASHRETLEELQASRQMVDELERQGMSISDLSNPKNYFKLFR